MNTFKFLIAIVTISSMSACVSSQKEMSHVKKEQVVEFSETEVPYIQVTKKNGKVTTEIVGVNSGLTTSN